MTSPISHLYIVTMAQGSHIYWYLILLNDFDEGLVPSNLLFINLPKLSSMINLIAALCLGFLREDSIKG